MLNISLPAVITATALSLQLVCQTPLPGPVARTGPLTIPDPAVNTTVISNDGVGNTITKIQQCELRSIGGGLYRVAATVNFALAPATVSLITGTLNLSVATPVWTPNQDVAAFNQTGAGVDEYQLSISTSGLIAVWDRYVLTTYPNSGAAANTFCCTRASTGVPFNINDIRQVTGVGAGGVDPHIGEELSNGHVILYHIDFLGAVANIVTADLNPVTGAMGPTSVAVPYTGTSATGFNHSPFVHRDSTGAARALNYSEYGSAGTGSHAYFTEGVGNDGTPELILNGQTPASRWWNNPGLVGGTWHYTTSGATEPHLQEVTMLANATITGGTVRIPAWAPARPQSGSGIFLSVVAIGINVGWLSLPPYPLPPVVNDLYVFQTLGILDFRIHDQFTGLAEWAFPVPPMNPAIFDMQLITLDGNANSILASNTAILTL